MKNFKEVLFTILITISIIAGFTIGGLVFTSFIQERIEIKKWEWKPIETTTQKIDEFSRLFTTTMLGQYNPKKFSDRSMCVMRTDSYMDTNGDYHLEGGTNYVLFVTAYQSNYVPHASLGLCEIDFIINHYMTNTNEYGYINHKYRYVTNMLAEVKTTIEWVTNKYKEHFKNNSFIEFDIGE